MVKYSMDDLTAVLRERGYSDMAQVEYAIIESDGKLNIIPKNRSCGITEDAGGDRQI